jgi:hypothetical protein
VHWKSTWNSSWAIIRCVAHPPPPVSFKQTLSDLLFMYFTHWAILYYWRTCSESKSVAKNMADLTPLPWLLVPRFMATTTVPTAILRFRRCTSPHWFEPKKFVFEVKIWLKILIFFFNLLDLPRILHFCAARMYENSPNKYCTRRIFYSPVRFLYFEWSWIFLDSSLLYKLDRNTNPHRKMVGNSVHFIVLLIYH